MDDLIGYLTAIVAVLIVAVSLGALALVITGATLPPLVLPKARRRSSSPALIVLPPASSDVERVPQPPDASGAEVSSPPEHDAFVEGSDRDDTLTNDGDEDLGESTPDHVASAELPVITATAEPGER